MTIAPSTTTSSPCHLRLYPIDQVLRFAVIDGVAHLTIIGKPVELNLVPGTLMPADQFTDMTHDKRHTFRVRSTGETDVPLLEAITHGHYVATYTDERGVERISGSPSHPLTFGYSRQQASWACTLSGRSLHPDIPYQIAGGI